MTHVLHRQLNTSYPIAVAGDGPYLIDANGKRFLDASGGAAVSCLGHSNDEVVERIKQQLDQLAFAHTAFFSSEPAERLAQFLCSRAPGEMDFAYLVSGGSEAMESALKLARQYYVEKGEAQRQCFIARRQSYHGNTLGVLGVGGNTARREAFAPLLVNSSHINPCYSYRHKAADESEIEYGLRAANELESQIEQLGPESVIGFVAETVGGASAGVLVPAPGYWQRIREICDHYGILLIADEVMCGMGRTGTLFAYEQENFSPDIVATGKGLGAGYQPIAAMLCRGDIVNTIAAGSGFFQHGHTYLGHPVACAAALAVQQYIENNALLSNVRSMGKKLQQSLNSQFKDYDQIGDIRGRGLFWGLELVTDKLGKTPHDPKLALHKLIKHHAMEQGLICYPGSGTADGIVGNHILLAPPFIINESHVAEIVEKLARAIDLSIAEISP